MRPAIFWLALKGSSEKANALIEKLNKRSQFELYKLASDPYELKDEIDNPEYKEVVEKMKEALMAKLQGLGDLGPIATEKSLLKISKKKSKNKNKTNKKK